ncbi:efflux RND transporter periplasmic adaptor subunit [Pedobacter suwonensis]|uniref:efflux RND transporter periplasmic adaptor subunit n=1 Tax=Pedobacter suwonensis TaxID=332999 RepID=UPI0016445D9B|nr:efflux RND transporter periplasmic adaptor subunit [Pedobacter suwonensis]
MKIGRNLFILAITAIFFQNCNNGTQEQTVNNHTRDEKDRRVLVEVSKVGFGDFSEELLSDGKIIANEKVALSFQSSGKLVQLSVKNGDRVVKGQVIGRLDPTELKMQLVRANENMDKAMIELDDRLIDYGYRLRDSSGIPNGIMKMAKIRSGFLNARYELANIKYSLQRSVLIAPFTGRIANLAINPNGTIDAYQKLCDLFNDSMMSVEFSVLETELGIVHVGNKIDVVAYGNELLYRGNVSEINPVIDNSGFIRVKAILQNTDGSLIDGMATKIIVKKTSSNTLFIPKEAIVQRQNRSVVFTCVNGRAVWNYVKRGKENTRYVSIESGLKPGDQVIVGNNLKLADNTAVKVQKLLTDNQATL